MKDFTPVSCASGVLQNCSEGPLASPFHIVIPGGVFGGLYRGDAARSPIDDTYGRRNPIGAKRADEIEIAGIAPATIANTVYHAIG